MTSKAHAKGMQNGKQKGNRHDFEKASKVLADGHVDMTADGHAKGSQKDKQ